MADTGRPSTYTQELADNICEQLALGNSMRTVCAADEMPAMSTVFKWLRENESFSEQYARAKQESSDYMAEELADISDKALEDAYAGGENKAVNAIVNAHRMRIDTRKWLMSKMKPKKYGEKLDLTTDGEKLPSPITTFNGILRDNSNPEDRSTD